MTDEAELRKRLELLREHMEAGKIVVAEHLKDGFQKSFGAVRYGSDGQVDLSTVDGRVRSMALLVAGMDQRKKVKDAVSLRDLQNAYFEYVEYAFGDLRKQMILSDAHPQSMSWAMSQHPETVEEVYPQIRPFVERLADFWSEAEEIVRYHLQDLQAAKGVYGGDLFPSYTHNMASTCGLYLDTIVLTDPFMNSRSLFSMWPKEEAVRFFVKHGLNVLSYKHLALADLDPPIIAIVPFRSSIDQDDQDWLGRLSEPDMLAHARLLFGRDFSSAEELAEFTTSIGTIEELVRRVKRQDRLLFDTDWTDPIDRQIARAIEESGGLLHADQPGLVVLNQSVGRMLQANDILIKSQQFGGTPLLDAPTSWQYLNWKLEYSAPSSPIDKHPLHVVRALQGVGEEAEWLGKIPADALIDMRKHGALHEIRTVMFEGVKDISDAQEGNFEQVSSRILKNLDDAYRKHRETMDDLKRKRQRFYGYEIGGWLVKGTIGVAAAITNNVGLALSALAAGEVLPGPNLREIPGKLRDLTDEEQRHRFTPMGLLFEHRES